MAESEVAAGEAFRATAGAGETVRTYGLKYVAAKEVAKRVEAAIGALSANAKVSADEVTNRVIVLASPEIQEILERMVDVLDRRVPN